MDLSFPNYNELKHNPSLAKDQEGRVWTLLCDKFEKMNNTPTLSRETIENNLCIYGTTTKFFNSNDYATVSFAIKFFDCCIVIPVHLYFNEDGQYNRWHSIYRGSIHDLSLMDFLNINHFKDKHSKLEFSLKPDKSNQTVYEIIKESYIITQEHPKIQTVLKYSFDCEHNVHLRGFESKQHNSSSNYSMGGFDKFETELMFLKFIKHVAIEKEKVDPDFLNYDLIDFKQTNWLSYVCKDFENNLIGEKRTAFLDYMKVIDMMII